MTISHQAVNGRMTGGDPAVTATLQQAMDDAIHEADNLAGQAAKHRAAVQAAQMAADQCETAGLAKRAEAERWRRHLDMERSAPADIPGEPMNDQGDVQTVLIPRIAYPIARTYLTWDEMPRRRCNGCLAILRDATDEEVAAANAGRDVPDVRDECPNCAPDDDRALDAMFGDRSAS